ncbi:helix-turn-helix domain-containing protein [Actinoplanes sp. Pm04-4]|uniref:Helix-turn-helix domain-containing protein n=1 Tax=Paractinoplanes pyxinae TaxID=2997416 RepID=A0ABT4B0U8_9ACTN|nr:helix-turn-helix domain-containing protein [Actinoplanes pyxinae]MCY1139525.1 helix-turn-helix domain-containing protein [Actinoplanes pyxinae]
MEHLVLPLASTTVIVDFGSRSGIVSGAREAASAHGGNRWGHGVSVGLTPLGVATLLGVPMREVGGNGIELADLMGSVATELPGMLGALRSWDERFDVLEALLGVAFRGGSRSVKLGRVREGVRKHGVEPEAAVTAAWWRLQRAEPPRVGVLADELGVSRRRLERGFRQHIGMSPATVARIARFQRVVGRFGAGASPADAAAGSGFADQSHLARETRAMAGMTPSALAAHLRTPPIVVSQTSKTGGARRF